MPTPSRPWPPMLRVGLGSRRDPSYDWSPTQIAWVAGLLEGEGYFALKNGGGKASARKSPMIRVEMSDEDVIARLAASFCRAYHEKAAPSRPSHWSAMFSTEVRGKDASEIMLLVRPYMGERRGAKIDQILAEYN